MLVKFNTGIYDEKREKVVLSGWLSVYNNWMCIDTKATYETAIVFVLHKYRNKFAMSDKSGYFFYALNTPEWPKKSGVGQLAAMKGAYEPTSKVADCTLWRFVGEKLNNIICEDSAKVPDNSFGQFINFNLADNYFYAKNDASLRRVYFAAEVMGDQRSRIGLTSNDILREWLGPILDK
jgi:hypothetical protein